MNQTVLDFTNVEDQILVIEFPSGQVRENVCILQSLWGECNYDDSGKLSNAPIQEKYKEFAKRFKQEYSENLDLTHVHLLLEQVAEKVDKLKKNTSSSTNLTYSDLLHKDAVGPKSN